MKSYKKTNIRKNGFTKIKCGGTDKSNLSKYPNTESINCCLCGEKITFLPISKWPYGNNPHPLMREDNDRCCDNCNKSYVLPTRRLMYFSRNSEELSKTTNDKGWVNNVEGTKKLVSLLSHFLN